jgi:hypothetical protein
VKSSVRKSACVKHAAQSSSRSVNRFLLQLAAPAGAAAKTVLRKVGGFLFLGPPKTAGFRKFIGIRAYSSSKSCMNSKEYDHSIDVQERLS